MRDEWQNITDFENSTNPQSAADTTRHLIGVLSDLDGGLGGKHAPQPSSSSKDIDVVGSFSHQNKSCL